MQISRKAEEHESEAEKTKTKTNRTATCKQKQKAKQENIIKPQKTSHPYIHTHTHTQKQKQQNNILGTCRTYWSVNATPSKVCQLHNSLLCLELPNQKHVQTSNETRETLHSAQVAPIPAARRRSIASHVGLLWVWMKSNA